LVVWIAEHVVVEVRSREHLPKLTDNIVGGDLYVISLTALLEISRSFQRLLDPRTREKLREALDHVI
jgi:hypothetical protein